MNEVRGALMEMAKTEESYSRKITALLQVGLIADPLVIVLS